MSGKPTTLFLKNMDVKHVAKLANLKLSENQAKKFASQFPAILDLVSKLKGINTEGVVPTFQVTGQENVFREDKIDTSRILKHDKKYFRVPAIFG